LAAVEEAGGEEDYSYRHGETGMEDVVQTEAEKSVEEPCGEAYEPDPCCLAQHFLILQR
jgi:hypothetical protein